MSEKIITNDYLKELGMRERSGPIEWDLEKARVITGEEIDKLVHVGYSQVRLEKGTEFRVMRVFVIPTNITREVKGQRTVRTYETTYFEVDMGNRRKTIPTKALMEPIRIPYNPIEGQDSVERLKMRIEVGGYYNVQAKSPSMVVCDLMQPNSRVRILDEIIVDHMATPNGTLGFDGRIRTTYHPFIIFNAD